MLALINPHDATGGKTFAPLFGVKCQTSCALTYTFFLLGVGIRHGCTEILPNEFGVLNDIGANLIEKFYFSPILFDYILWGVLEVIFEAFKKDFP